MNLTIKVDSSQLDAICWEAKRNINSEISENTEGTMGTLSAILSEEGLQPPFQIIGSQGSWIRGSEPYLTSVAVDILTKDGIIYLTIT